MYRRLEEYLRRRYRLQRVEEQIQRNVVTNFFLTLYWSKRFKDLRKTTLASVNPVPQIFVNDISSEPSIPQITLTSSGPVTPPPITPPSPEPPTAPPEGSASGYSPVEFSFAGVDPFSDDSPSVLRQRPGRRTPPSASPGTSPLMSPRASPNISPSASPRITGTHAGGWFGGAGQQSQSTLQNQQPGPGGAGRERVGSDVAPVRGVLDDIEEGEWKDQIRSFIEGRASTDGGRPP
jgi:hypothetical protein